MAKNALKVVAVFAAMSAVLLPVQPALASMVLSDASGTIIENAMNASSMEFQMDVDIETNDGERAQPVKMHVDLDGAEDDKNNTSFDAGFWIDDGKGAFHEANGSVVFTDHAVYFSKDADEWYVATMDELIDLEDENSEESLTTMKNGMSELFARGVIEYQFETMEVMNKTMTARYAYTVNTDRLVDYVVAKGELSAGKPAEDAKKMLTENVTIGGAFWVDTRAMLPVMFTMNVAAHSGVTSYTNVNVSVLFKSFNADITIAEPKHAKDIEELSFNASENMTIASVTNVVATMDTDGDGLTNEEEEGTWKTNPLSADSDSDGYADRTEVINGYNPNGAGKLDSDKDGLTDYAEMTIHWTNRFDSDSDNDGYKDGVEIANGYNPNGSGKW